MTARLGARPGGRVVSWGERALVVVLAALSSASADPDEYRLGPNDVVHLDVYGQKADLGGDYIVTSGGHVAVPFCGEGVPVALLTVLEAQDAIRDCLAVTLRDPQLKLTVVEHRSQRVELVGAVAKPGDYYLDGAISLRAMLARAGGVELERSTGVVAVVRGEERIELPLDQVGGETDTVRLQPGDVILVEQSEVVLVGGQVAKPGPIAFTDGMTVMQALLRAGDATPVANLAGSYILRDEEKIAVNIRKMRKGRGADFVLEPGDTLFVPESPL